MPRLDNSSIEVINYYDISDFDPDDPGKSDTVDLCVYCFDKWKSDGLEIEHPPYEDWDKTCKECGCPLEEVDNRY